MFFQAMINAGKNSEQIPIFWPANSEQSVWFVNPALEYDLGNICTICKKSSQLILLQILDDYNYFFDDYFDDFGVSVWFQMNTVFP